MIAPIPTAVPHLLRAGDTATWKRALPNYPASEGWTLEYFLVCRGHQLTFSATPDGDSHLVEVGADTTLTWPASRTYQFQERVTKSGKTFTVSSGYIQVLPSLAAATTGFDTRTHAQKTLEALEAWIENRDLGVAEYQVGTRQLKTIPISELLILRDRYRREARADRGEKVSSRILLRSG